MNKLIWSKLTAEEKNRAVGEAFGVTPELMRNPIAPFDAVPIFPNYSRSLDACFALAKENHLFHSIETKAVHYLATVAKFFDQGMGSSENSAAEATCIALLRFKGVEIES